MTETKLNSTPSPTSRPKITVSPLRCFTGGLISGGIGTALYLLTVSIFQTFASKPIQSDNQLTVNLAAAVRTLVMGIGALATGIFALTAVGLFALGIQILIQNLTKNRSVSS